MLAMSTVPIATAQALDPSLQAALVRYLTALADDEIVIGHRASEWTGLGPILEEDIAFSSMAQDELGHAWTLYSLLEGFGQGTPDAQAFLRGPEQFLNAQLCEAPRGDYGYSLVRAYLYDLAEAIRLDALTESRYEPLAAAAAKLRQEEKYHLMHGRTWVQKLAMGGDESRGHIQTGLDAVYPACAGLFEPVEGEDALVSEGIVPASAELYARWRSLAEPFLESAGLTIPTGQTGLGGRRGQHTPELAPMLEAMQMLYRADPAAKW